jgi:aminoglycoside phosphotransferase (APT) family kinase protein
LARLARHLNRGAAALAGHAPATLHGDLHPGNILIDGSDLAFIDLDSVQIGPAVFELGGWIAYLLYSALLDAAPLRSAAASCHAFVAAYSSASSQAVDPALLAWSTAHHLLCRRACGGLATLKPGRFAAVPALLALAETIAQAGTIDAAFDRVREAA